MGEKNDILKNTLGLRNILLYMYNIIRIKEIISFDLLDVQDL